MKYKWWVIEADEHDTVDLNAFGYENEADALKHAREFAERAERTYIVTRVTTVFAHVVTKTVQQKDVS